MLLFTDGFEYFHSEDIYRKWGRAVDAGTLGDIVVVQGMDNSVNPPQKFARKEDGKAILFSGDTNEYDYRVYSLYAPIRKSRTVHLGFGFRSSMETIIKLKFFSRTNVENAGLLRQSSRFPKNLVATCTLVLAATAMTIQWEFPSSSVPMQVGSINSNTNLNNGEWFYTQVGITLHGNNTFGDNTAWVKNTLGSTKSWEATGIATADPEGENSFYIDSVGFSPTSSGISIDDFYISNDEGEVNNDFLGPIHIRSVTTYQQGAHNDSILINAQPDADSATILSADSVGTVETMPTVIPTPEEDQHFVSWTDVREQYIRINRIEEKQTYRHGGVNFAGAQPDFIGLIAYPMVRSHYYDMGQTSLEPLMFSELTEVKASAPLVKPVTFQFNNEWEVRRMIFENPRTVQEGFEDPIWNRTAINNLEIGFKLARYDQDPLNYLPGHLRLNYTHDILMTECLAFTDWASRHWEAVLLETFNIDGLSIGEWTFALTENLNMSDGGSDGVKATREYVNSVVRLEILIPWYFFFINDVLDCAETTQITWLQPVLDALGVDDSTYHFWVEEFAENFNVESLSGISAIETVQDALALTGQIKSNQELIEDGLQIDSSYLFSGHEWVEETIYPNSQTSFGWVERIFDICTFGEDHFDGWFVAVIPHQFSVTCEVLTQHWRYDWIMGLCVASYQIEPIEQPGDEFNKTGLYSSEFGDTPSTYWDIENYTGEGL